MIYLDHAATSMLRPTIIETSIIDALNNLGNSGRGGSITTLRANRAILECRIAISDLVYPGHPERVAFTSGATESLNILINSIPPNTHVITTALEHNSVLRPLYRMAKTQNIMLTILPCNLDLSIHPNQIEESIQPNTSMVITTGASNVSGNILDTCTIGGICKKHNILYAVDASQLIGHEVITLDKNNIDILCFSGHKGLLAPQGIGAIVVRDTIELNPIKVGGSGFDSYNHSHPTSMPERLEAGTLNTIGIAGLTAGIRYLESYPLIDSIKEANNLYKLFISNISHITNIHYYGNIHGSPHIPLLSLNIGNLSSSTLADILESRYNIIVRSGAHCAPLIHKHMNNELQGAVRFSFSHLNTTEEIYIATEAISSIAKEYEYEK